MKNNFPETCVFCDNFPCLASDAEASVCCELKGSYPFVLEDPNLKPCRGEDFVPVFIENDTIDDESKDTIETVTGETIAEKKITTYKKPYVIKAPNSEVLQLMLDKFVDDEDVVSFEISGITSLYDVDSGSTKTMVILVVEYEKKELVSDS